MQWYNWVLIAFGVCIVLDGLGSAWIKGEQYHNVWFDGERYGRALLGAGIIILGLIIPGGVLVV